MSLSSSAMSSASTSSSSTSTVLSSIAEAATSGSTASAAAVAVAAAAVVCWEGNGSSGSLLLPAQHPSQLQPQHHLAPDADGNEPGKLFIGGLSQATTEASLRAHFSQFGQLDSAVVMMDSVSGRSRGFGFVKFKDPASATAALQQHQGPDEQQCLDGKTIDVKQSNVRVRGSRAALTRHLKVFVGGVPPEADAQLVRAQFSQYGRVLDVNLMPDPARQRHRGFAFVTFEDERVVQRLVQVHFVELAGRLVEVKAMKPPSAAVLPQTQPPPPPPPPQQHQQQQQQLLPQLQQQQQQQSLLLMQQAAPLSCQLHQQQLHSQQRQQLALLHHQQQQAFLTTGSSGSGAGGNGGALPLLANACSWQPAVAFDPGLAWAAAAAWTEPHQQQQLQQLQQQQQQHYHQHLSIMEPTTACWLSQPLLAAATATPWPPATAGLLPLQSFSRQPQAQQQQQQQQSQQQQQPQQQQQCQTLSAPAGPDAVGNAPWHLITVANGGGGIVSEKEFPLPIGTGLSGQHSQSQSALLIGQQSVQQQPSLQPHQLQQQQPQQQRQQNMQPQQQQQPDQQLLLQSRAAGDFGGRTN